MGRTSNSAIILLQKRIRRSLSRFCNSWTYCNLYGWNLFFFRILQTDMGVISWVWATLLTLELGFLINVCRTSSCYSSLIADDRLSGFERFFTLPVSLKRSVVFDTVDLLIRRFEYVSLNNRTAAEYNRSLSSHPRIKRG